MNNGGGNGAGCFEVNVWADAGKFTNVIVARLIESAAIWSQKLDLNNNSLKHRTAISLQPTPLATLVSFSTNTLPSRIKSLHFLSLATSTSVNFAVSAHTVE